MKTLLGIFAHPDDESVNCGGTMAKYAKAGWKIHVICATGGEAGSWGGVVPESDITLAQARASELDRATKHLGVSSHRFLTYKDGQLDATTPGDIENALWGPLDEIRPDVVITSETHGMTNHPDHVRLSYAATFAFHAYAKRRHTEYPENPEPPKLYYACFPESLMSYLVESKRFPKEMFGKPVLGVPDKKITTVIDIKRFAGVKRKALMAHETQYPELEKYLAPKSPFLSHEYFMLRYQGITESFMGKQERVSDRL